MRGDCAAAGKDALKQIERMTMRSFTLSLRPSAYLSVLCVTLDFNAEVAEMRRGPQRN
jgi:hypothetical protein